jgi:hypothetical protein
MGRTEFTSNLDQGRPRGFALLARPMRFEMKKKFEQVCMYCLSNHVKYRHTHTHSLNYKV